MLRPGEAQSLRWNDIDFDERQIDMNRSLNLATGANCPQGNHYVVMPTNWTERLLQAWAQRPVHSTD